MKRTVIIGGGMLGLTLAWRLRRTGRQVTVLEAAPEIGGLASAWSLALGHGRQVTWDRHYHVTLASDLALRGLLDELGLTAEVEFGTTKTGFYTDGQLYSMSTTLEFLSFPPLSPIDKLRLGATIWFAANVADWRALEQVPVEDWLRRWSGDTTFDRIWRPLLLAKLGESYRRTSASFIWATIARMYAARRSGLKVERFGYVRGGYARVLERFAERLRADGVILRTSAPVAAVENGLSVRLASGELLPADEILVTTAPPLAHRLCTGLTERERTALAGLDYQGIVCASVVLDRPLGGYYVTNVTDTWVPFTGVIEMSALVPGAAQFAGKTLVYLPKYVDPQDPLFEATDSEIRERFVGALRRMYPFLGPESVLGFQVSRVRNVFPIPTLGYSAKVPPMRTSVPGLWLVNSSQIVNGTLNVNETVQLADRAVAELAG